ncbi:unnamed protein product [Rotaria socialis]
MNICALHEIRCAFINGCIYLLYFIDNTYSRNLSCSLMRTQYEHQEDIALARGTALAESTTMTLVIRNRKIVLSNIIVSRTLFGGVKQCKTVYSLADVLISQFHFIALLRHQ